MKEITRLREMAREKRDKLIAHARAEYAATLVQIAAVEQDLLGKRSSRFRRASDAIMTVLPTDGSTFSTVDLMASLEALDHTRVWEKRTVVNQLGRLRKRGVIKRVKRQRRDEPAVYAMVDAAVPAGDDRTLVEVIQTVLVRPMTMTEITFAVLDAGYRTRMSKRNLRAATGQA